MKKRIEGFSFLTYEHWFIGYIRSAFSHARCFLVLVILSIAHLPNAYAGCYPTGDAKRKPPEPGFCNVIQNGNVEYCGPNEVTDFNAKVFKTILLNGDLPVKTFVKKGYYSGGECTFWNFDGEYGGCWYEGPTFKKIECTACREDQISTPNGCACPTGTEEIEGQCLPECEIGDIRNDEGECISPPPELCRGTDCICFGPLCEFFDDDSEKKKNPPPPGKLPDGIPNGNSDGDDDGCKGEDCGCSGPDCYDGNGDEKDEDPAPPYKCAPQAKSCQPIRESACLLPQYNGSELLPALQVTARGDKRLDTACHSVPYKDEVLSIALNYDGLYVGDDGFSDRADNLFGPGWTMNHMQRLRQSAHHPVSATEKEDDTDTIYYYTLSSGEEFIFTGKDGALDLYPEGLSANGSTVRIREEQVTETNWQDGASYIYFEDGSFEVYKTLDAQGLIRAACTPSTAICKVYGYTEEGLLSSISLMEYTTTDSLGIIAALEQPGAGALKRKYSVKHTTVNGEDRIFRIKDVTPAVVSEALAGTFYFTYYSSGLLSSITWPDGAKERFGYDSFGKLVRHFGTAENGSDPRNSGNAQNGAYMLSVYDASGRIGANRWMSASDTVLAEQTITYYGDDSQTPIDDDSEVLGGTFIDIATIEGDVTLATTHVTVDHRKRIDGISVPDNSTVKTTFTHCSDIPSIPGCSFVQNSNNVQFVNYPLGAAKAYKFDEKGHVTEVTEFDTFSPELPEYKGDEPNEPGSPNLFPGTTAPSAALAPETSVVNAAHNWVTVSTASHISTPVVIAGVPSFNGGNAGVVQVKDVNKDGFSIRFAEWNYLDGAHAIEQIPYAVFESGSYTYADGTVVEAGTFTIDGTRTLESIKFDSAFLGTPHIFLSPQTVNESDPITVRAKNVSTTGFSAALYEEELLNNGHAPEVIGYVAIYPGSGTSGTLAGVSYTLSTLSLTHTTGKALLLQEEQSKDSETGHTSETIRVMTLDGEYFGQDVSINGGDTHSLRKP